MHQYTQADGIVAGDATDDGARQIGAADCGELAVEIEILADCQLDSTGVEQQHNRGDQRHGSDTAGLCGDGGPMHLSQIGGAKGLEQRTGRERPQQPASRAGERVGSASEPQHQVEDSDGCEERAQDGQQRVEAAERQDERSGNGETGQPVDR
jgi:hypothetical protein